jgi:hypothetical protein
LKTFAVILGKKWVTYLLHIVNLLSFIPLVLGIYNNIVPKEAFLLILAVLYGFYYLIHVLFLTGKNLRNFSYIIVDAEYIFWPIWVIIGKMIL